MFRRSDIERLWLRLMTCLLAVIIGAQGTLAFFPGANGASGGMVVELCAAGEVRQVTINPDTGEPVPQERDTATCAFCIMPGFVQATASMHAPRPVSVAVLTAPAPAAFRPAASRLAGSIRAPPFSRDALI